MHLGYVLGISVVRAIKSWSVDVLISPKSEANRRLAKKTKDTLLVYSFMTLKGVPDSH